MMIKLTNLGDRVIWINPALIELIKEPIFSIHGRDCNAVILLSGKEYCVKETPMQIINYSSGYSSGSSTGPK